MATRPELQGSAEGMTRADFGRWAFILLVIAALSLWASALPAAQSATAARSSGGEEFFIISSVDSGKMQLLVKEPTEITEVVQVTGKTRYTDKNGKPIQFSDLRAGDTVFIRMAATPKGKAAVNIRKGPMTVEELHRRYLK